MRRGGVGVDIVDIVGYDTSILHGACHGCHATVVARLGNASTIARETVAKYFGEDRGPTGDGVVVVFQHEGCSTAAGHQSVAVTVERTAGLRGVVHTDRESTKGVERCHGVVVRLLGTTTEHHALQALLDHHITQSDGVAATGTGGRDGKVHATQVEDGTEVHVHRRVHRLEDIAVAQHGRVVFLCHELR